MKVCNLVISMDKQDPADCTIDSQKIMVRGGYIKYVHNGVYTLSPVTKRMTAKVEAIIREEMNAIDGQEVMFPVVMNSDIWEESGRYASIGNELVRFKDRNGARLVLGMTHEEAAVHYARNIAQSYTQFPFMIYQIQTKFRDEPRPRGGLIRVREFTMKDAYSFHLTQADLDEYYERAYKAYERIFARAGAKNVVAVKSDSGMMGGSVSHEFMLISPVGEDTIAYCNECGYRANVEVAKVLPDKASGSERELKEVATPGVKTIDGLSALLSVDKSGLCKAVVYQKNADDKYVVAFVRGDRDINETKLRNLIGADIHPAHIEADSGLVEGFIGPIGLPKDITVVYDVSLEGCKDLVCGANKKDAHLTGLSVPRDLAGVKLSDVSKIRKGDVCPGCGKHTVEVDNSIEVGNIFQLGTKYTKSMGMTYLDAEGKACHPIMGCYGIGVGRLVASICEESHDAYGPIWPISIAPWQVEICALRTDDPAVREYADRLYAELEAAGVEVLYDDRNIRPGAMFAEADLFGIPLRVVVSPKNMANGVVELSYRDHSFKGEAALCDAVPAVKEHIAKLFDAIKA